MRVGTNNQVSFLTAQNGQTNGRDQYYYGHGKVLLSGEYFILDGALALALPTTVGQSLSVKYRPSYEPLLHWKSYNREGKVWCEAKFEFWHFNVVQTKMTEEVALLQTLLKQVRKQNTHFLRDEVDVMVETRLEFPLSWGLGASSTLINNISQWAYVSPFELLFRTLDGSGYDVACAQSQGPILYKKGKLGPKWTMVHFDPPFKDKLYFVHLGKKQNSRDAIHHYRERQKDESFADGHYVPLVSKLTRQFLEAATLEEFERAMREHEALIATAIGLPPVKEKLFADYWGEVKSLGAWGGDFVLVTSTEDRGKTQKYFMDKGFDVFVSFRELIKLADPNESGFGPTQKNNHHLLDPFFGEESEGL